MEKLISKHIIWNTLKGINLKEGEEVIVMTPIKGHEFSFIDRIIWVPLAKLYLAPFKKWKFIPSALDPSFGCVTQDKYFCKIA